MNDESSVWEQPDRVEEFAQRDADVRLLELCEGVSSPSTVRVLDLGCAGGRNTVVLARLGFDVFALDSSAAMVAKTRQRLAEITGELDASRRVRRGRMEDLSEFADGFFDLVVALGVYHNARNRADWDRALSESARVLADGGRVLVANFSPKSNPDGKGMRPVEGEPDVYVGFGAERLFLLEADELDGEMSRHGLEPDVPSKTVARETEKGVRVVVNALYRKRTR
ncbi:MAG: class I SAM-dependent methyltransferase [Candidatus Latescibacterota bacterium]|jgi:SAM-dependent methyltransferase